MNNKKMHCENWLKYKRFQVPEVNIGTLKMGASHPIVVQSMVNTDTMNTEATSQQTIELIDSGCQLVRITAQGVREAENLQAIKENLKQKNIYIPLVADIHFAPNAANIAATIVDKVRINPGNYVDKKKNINTNYTHEEYLQELKKIEEKFIPFLDICKKNGTAIRIGSNHGSLSERIINKYGNTPNGMVEAAMEFLRICKKENFHEIVVSMKASNTQVMTQASRLLAYKMNEENLCYPIHLGVTEAGKGEDGIVKSAIGIAALLVDGIGDTIRVSLTEHPKKEIPVAQKIINITQSIINTGFDFSAQTPEYFDAFQYQKRKSSTFKNIGGSQVPIVIADYKKANMLSALQADYFFSEKAIHFPSQKQIIIPVQEYLKTNNSDTGNKQSFYPLFSTKDYHLISECTAELKFVCCNTETVDNLLATVNKDDKIILVSESQTKYGIAEQRAFFFSLEENACHFPVVLRRNYKQQSEDIRIEAACELGPIILDGMGDGLWIQSENSEQNTSELSFGILQGSRVRMSKTEFISCPSCGRTLFDLEETSDKIKAELSHLKSLKIGVMGCIVNGPGEMADADYGYVGAGKGKVSLYKGQELVRKNIPSASAVKELIELIKEHGDWVEPK